MNNGHAQRIQESPSPAAREPGWYPDPLGSTAERYWDGSWTALIRKPEANLVTELPGQGSEGQRKRGISGRRLPLARIGRKTPARGDDQPSPKEVRATLRAEQKRLAEIAARKAAFFESPAGRARLSFAEGQQVFQCELELARPEPLLIPGFEGAAPRSTNDPVDILNSVIDEGWKLVAGSFTNAEMRGGAVGIYLFKRSKKRHRVMGDPWMAPLA